MLLKDKLPQIRNDIDSALALMCKSHELRSMLIGKITYDPTMGNFTFKVEGVDGGGKTMEEIRYDTLRASMRLPAIGTKFTSTRGEKYVVVGMNTTCSKILCKSSGNGKTYLFKPEAVVLLTASGTKKGG